MENKDCSCGKYHKVEDRENWKCTICNKNTIIICNSKVSCNHTTSICLTCLRDLQQMHIQYYKRDKKLLKEKAECPVCNIPFYSFVTRTRDYFILEDIHKELDKIGKGCCYRCNKKMYRSEIKDHLSFRCLKSLRYNCVNRSCKIKYDFAGIKEHFKGKCCWDDGWKYLKCERCKEQLFSRNDLEHHTKNTCKYKKCPYCPEYLFQKELNEHWNKCSPFGIILLKIEVLTVPCSTVYDLFVPIIKNTSALEIIINSFKKSLLESKEGKTITSKYLSKLFDNYNTFHHDYIFNYEMYNITIGTVRIGHVISTDILND